MSAYRCKVQYGNDWEDVEGHDAEEAVKNFCERLDERMPPEGFGQPDRPEYVFACDEAGEIKKFKVHTDWIKTFDVLEVA